MIMPSLPPVMCTEMVNQLYDGIDARMQLLKESIEYEERQWLFDSADEEGISRYEKIMSVVPAKTDSLESRRNAIAYKWNSFIPYTRKDLENKLTNWCPGGYSYSIETGFICTFNLYVSFNQPNQADYIYRQLTAVLPANFIINIRDVDNEKHVTDFKLSTSNRETMKG